MTNGNDSACPVHGKYDSNLILEGGLTKREYFAAIAMQGYLASCDGWASSYDLEEISKRSVIAADALITSLNQTQTP